LALMAGAQKDIAELVCTETLVLQGE
jgi:hypothetical protein